MDSTDLEILLWMIDDKLAILHSFVAIFLYSIWIVREVNKFIKHMIWMRDPFWDDCLT